jgi:hypothetical protein
MKNNYDKVVENVGTAPKIETNIANVWQRLRCLVPQESVGTITLLLFFTDDDYSSPDVVHYRAGNLAYHSEA